MRNILILLFLILFLGLTAALDCQYQTTQPYEKQVQVLYSNEDNQVLNPQVSYDDFQSVGFGNLEKTFKIFNKSDFEIAVKVFFYYYYDFPQPQTPNEKIGEFNEIINVNAHDFNTVYVGRVFTSYGFTNPYNVLRIDQDSIKLVFVSNDYYNAKYENKTFEEQFCKICGDKNCFNDGQECSLINECGGGYCVKGVCNSTNVCFGLNCNCTQNQVQCFNQICADKNAVEIGYEPTCNKAECKNYFFIDDSNKCAIPPEIIKAKADEEFNNNLRIIITFILIAIIVIILIFVNKVLFLVDKFLNKIPRLNNQFHLIFINENGYEQFLKSIIDPSKTGDLFHRWYAKKNIYDKNRKMYPLEWREYEVHHKDQNKRNNDLSNLQILTIKQHKEIHKISKNWGK